MSCLPKYASPESSPRAGGARDLLATFYSEERDSITVSIERGEEDQFYLVLSRSGLVDNTFSKRDLGRVIDVAKALYDQL